MDASHFDALPLIIFEVAPVRDATGQIVDLEWIGANRLMNESALPGGKSVVGLRMFEIDPGCRDTEIVRAVIEVINTGEPRTLVTHESRAAHMPVKVIQTSIVPTARGALACSHEITGIAQERDEAREQFELAKAACDHALHPIVLTSTAARILYVNRALCEMLGYDENELVDQNVGIIFGAKAFRGDPALNQKIAASDVIQHIGETNAVTKSGRRIPVEARLSSARASVNGELVYISYFRDISEERRQADDLRDALHRAEQATRLKSEFLANMSHEIRTPLNGVLGMAQVLSHTSLTPAQDEQVSVILDSGQTLMVLLNDILDLSKIEAGQMEVSPVAGDLRHKLSRLYKLHETAAREKDVTVDLFVHPSVPSRLMFDAVRVRQCVGNLVSNAIKFTAKGKVLIAVSSQPEPDNQHLVTVHVSDTGCGIAADKIERVFESFAQEDGSTTRRFGGTGLGLPITRKLAQLMGGTVTAVSEQGKGSVFTLTFKAGVYQPVILDSGSEVSLLPARGLHSSLEGDLSGRRALVADDNAINRRVARSFLELHGLIVTEGVDGRDALGVLERERFDVVLMDIHMPILDGAEAFKRLRAVGGPNQNTPIVALTADCMRGDRERFLAKGFDGYVSKPIDERSLITAITQVLSIQEPEFRPARLTG